MLKFFRNQKNSWLMKGILTLTALSFVSLFGLSRTIERIPDEGKAIISVDGKNITVAQYINELTQRIRFIGKMTQRPFSMKDAVESGLLLSQLRHMFVKATKKGAVERLKLAVPDDDVRTIIKENELFTGIDGSFNMSAYKKYLSEMGVSEKDFVDSVFLDLRMNQLQNSSYVLSPVSRDIAKLNYRIQNEKRSAYLFSVKPSELKITGNPTKQEKEELYKEISEELMSPEYRSFTVMALTMDEISKKIKPSEEELKKVYEDNKADYTVEEIRNVDQMLFTSQDEADEAYAALQNGRDFMTVAKEIARQTEDQTKLGEITPSTATGDWADIVFSAKKGDVIAPVQTAFGWQILRVNKITPKVEKTFKEVRDEIRRKLVSSKAFDVLSETAVSLDDRFGAGETIEEIAKTTGLPVQKYTMLDSSGSDENGHAADVSKTVLATAFLQEAGKESPMMEDGNGFFVLRVDDIREPALKPIEKSEKEIRTAWLSGKRQERAKEIVEEMEELLNKGMTPKAVSRKTGIPFKKVDGITRQESTLPDTVVFQLFNQPLKTVISQSFDDEYIVAQAVSARQADAEKDPVGVEKMRELLKMQRANEKYGFFFVDMSIFLGATIHQDVSEKVDAYLTKSIQENEED